nr:substrate-binding domain-containing protein [Humitalea rosea]
MPPARRAAAADILRIGGTGAATALMTYLAVAFTAKTGIGVRVIPSLGSSGGIRAAADGLVDIALSGRPLSAAETARGLRMAGAIRTPYVFATSHPAPPSMTPEAIVAAFQSPRMNWPDGSRIKVVLRPRAESDNQVMIALLPGMDAALDAARRRPELPTAATDQDNADMALDLGGSLIGATLTQMLMEHRDLRLIPINGVTPTAEALRSGAYPFAKDLHLVHFQVPSEPAVAFMRFMRSPEAIGLLNEAGCLPGAN